MPSSNEGVVAGRAAASGQATRTARDVTVRGVRTRAVELGPLGAPPVVLLHGFLASHHTFDEVIEPLAERFRVIAPDLPGFGASEKPSPSRYPYGIEGFAESVADLIAALGVGPASIVGHGMGAAVALTLATSHVELATRLVLVDALCYPFPLGALTRAMLLPVVGSIAFKQLYGRGLFRAHFRDNVFSEAADFPASRVEDHYDTFNTPSARESAYAVLRATLDTRPVVARLSRIQVPSLVVWGRSDRIFPVSGAQRLARELPFAKLAILESGHSPHEECAGEFLSAVLPFLQGKR